MKLLSVNTGQPREFIYQGKPVTTAIFKQPVNGSRNVSFTGMDGDLQSDTVHHGGALKAVYAYDVAYYDQWKKILRRTDSGYVLFGENLTTRGLTDVIVMIGDIYEVGSVHIKAIQPRFPCIKLNIRFEMDDMLQRFVQQGKHGIYFSVVKEGSVQPGDSIRLIKRSAHPVSIQQLVTAYYNKGMDKQIVEQVLAIEFLPQRLRTAFESYT